MIVWGGCGCAFAGGCYLNTGGRYSPTTNSWTATSTTSAPDARNYHTAVWTGSQMIVWGGQSNIGYFNTGGRYCAQSGPTPTATPTATHTPTPTPTPTSTPGGTPAPPIANAAMSIASNSFTANWSSVSGATGYRLDVSTSSSFNTYVPGYQNLNVGNATTHSVTGLNASTTY